MKKLIFIILFLYIYNFSLNLAIAATSVSQPSSETINRNQSSTSTTSQPSSINDWSTQWESTSDESSLWWMWWVWWNWWINCNSDLLIAGQCSMSTYETLTLKKQANPTLFVRDIVSWATFFIWTIVSISLIISGIMYIWAWWDESMATKWKNWITYSIVWLLLVMFSFLIIRFVQEFSRW